MKNFNKALTLSILLLAGLSACKEEQLEGVADDINVDFQINNGIESDSVKVGLKTGSEDYTINISTQDLTNLSSLTVDVLEGDIEVYQNNSLVSSLTLSSNMEVRVVFVSAEPVTLRFTATDIIGTTIQKDIQLIVFANIAPVAIMSVTQVGLTHPLEVELSGEDSYDRDARFGGEISAYEWELDGIIFDTDDLIEPYIFSRSGSHVIKLRVQDNDGSWSPQIVETINLN